MVRVGAIEFGGISVAKLNLMAYDLGASSGRAMLGEFDGKKIEISELHRFLNEPVQLCRRFCWDIQREFFEMKAGLLKAQRAGLKIDGIGIDTRGVDFGLLNKNGDLMGIPVHYRDSRTEGVMEKAFEIVPKDKIFEETGLAFMNFNTLYQLLAMRLEGDPALDAAKTMLFVPDLLAYFFTGEMATEYTIASTSQMINPRTRDWAKDLLEKLNIPTGMLTGIQPAGTVRGHLLGQIQEELGVGAIPVIAVGSHDTASAVASVPAQKDATFAYLSSGTWSLLGAEMPHPVISPEVMAANYTNEGGISGTTRLLKNIMGLWIIQECKREWDRRADAVDFAGLVKMAEGAKPFMAQIDVDDPRFMAPGNMPARIQEYCRETHQEVPQSRGEISRVVYESLALKYRWGVERLEKDLLGKHVDVLHIVGGGSKNEMLNKFTASAIGRPVVAGPSEGTAIGNLLVQAMALGEISGLDQLREVVRVSFPTQEYLPERQEGWDDAYANLLKLMGE